MVHITYILYVEYYILYIYYMSYIRVLLYTRHTHTNQVGVTDDISFTNFFDNDKEIFCSVGLTTRVYTIITYLLCTIRNGYVFNYLILIILMQPLYYERNFIIYFMNLSSVNANMSNTWHVFMGWFLSFFPVLRS